MSSARFADPQPSSRLDEPPDQGALRAAYLAHVDELAARYASVMVRHQLDAIVLHTGSPQKKSVFDDQYWPLVVVPHTKHWIALEEPDCAVVVRAGARPLLVRNGERSFWEQPPALAAPFALEAFEVVEARDTDAIKAHLPKGRRAFVGEDRGRAAAWGFEEDEVAPARLLGDLDALRVTKTPYEVLCLDEANRRCARGHRAVLAAFLSGDQSELDLHLAYLQATEQDDPETPYKNIVALGEHAATLHHVSYGRRRSGAQSLLLDAGATFLGYDSDVTRTAVKGTGAAADAFAQLVAGVDRLQRELCAKAQPGHGFEALHNHCHELLAQALREVGIAKASAAELVDSGATRAFLPHGLGHSLGIQTHDVGCRRIEPEPRNPFLRNTSTMSAGQVFTIEPGCYFIAPLLEGLREKPVGASIDWRLVEALTPFGGVRIEDDVEMTPMGVRNLTRAYL